MTSAFLRGTVCGQLRLLSGSVIVASMSHDVWDGIDCALFAFGEKIGALGIGNTALFGPEVGIIGLGLNALYAAFLWPWWRPTARRRTVA